MTPPPLPVVQACPFCGGSEIKVFEADDIGGWLAGCCAQTWGATEAEAITAWNTRPSQAPLAVQDGAVIQADRNAAAATYDVWQPTHLATYNGIKAGACDELQLVRSYAAHRLASQAPLLAQLEEMREALEKVRKGLDLVDPGRPIQYAQAMDLMRQCADAALAKGGQS